MGSSLCIMLGRIYIHQKKYIYIYTSLHISTHIHIPSSLCIMLGRKYIHPNNISTSTHLSTHLYTSLHTFTYPHPSASCWEGSTFNKKSTSTSTHLYTHSHTLISLHHVGKDGLCGPNVRKNIHCKCFFYAPRGCTEQA